MTTMRDLVADTRRVTYGSMADQLNFLAQEYTADATELFLTMDVTPITQGTVLSSGLNVWYVTSVDSATKRVTVYPNYGGSPSGTIAAGQPVMIRPRVTDWLLFTYVNDVVKALSSPTYGLYKQGSWTDPNTNNPWATYAIPVEAQGATSLIRVQVQDWYGSDLWYDVPMQYVEWQPENNLVRLRNGIPAGRPLKFDYRAPFAAAVDLDDDAVDDMGLSESMLDLPPLGAAVRLLRTTESRRSQIHAQGDSRRAEEVPPGAAAGSAGELSREFRQRVNDEYIRLVARNPILRMPL